jgi:hypothetical protein
MSQGDRIRAFLGRDPFLPFTIRRTSGEDVRITLPHQAWFPPGVNWVEVTPDSATSNQRIMLDDVEVVTLGESREAVAPMTVEKFDEFLKRRPFEPFTIHVADGSKIGVMGPEFASRTQAGRTIYVATGGERTEWIDLLLVTRLGSGIDNARASEAGAA